MGEVATYGLYVDWNNDGDFSDSGEDITSDFISGTISRGYSGPLARVPTVGRATLVLRNLSKAYSPPLESDVLPRRSLKLKMTYGATTKTLFRGFLDSIEPTFGQYGDRRAVLECVDAMALLDLYEGEIPLLTGVYADEIIEDVVDAVYTPPANDYQDGINFFATSAAGWHHEGDEMEEVRASKKIEEVCASDWGRFFIAGDGTASYYNRHQMPLDTSTELTMDDTMLGMAYRKAVTTVYNHVEVTCYPRSVGTVYEVLASLSQRDAPTIEANDSRTFVLRFRDPVNARLKVGGKDCVTPVAGTDFECTSDPEGEGDNENGNITPSASFYGDQAEIELANGASHAVFVQKLQVRGKAVRVRERLTMVATDSGSISAYQRRKLRVQAPLMSDAGDAQLLADFLLAYYKDPLHEVRDVEILANKDPTWMAAVRDLELMDKVVLSETQTGLSSFSGFIYHMKHDIKTRYEHRLRLCLEEGYTISGMPFRIGVSQFNSGHVLIY